EHLAGRQAHDGEAPRHAGELVGPERFEERDGLQRRFDRKHGPSCYADRLRRTVRETAHRHPNSQWAPMVAEPGTPSHWIGSRFAADVRLIRKMHCKLHLQRKVRRQRGAALILSMISITALLSLGALTVLTVQVEQKSTGLSRIQQSALYAAESGAYAGVDFLRANCQTVDLFSQYLSANNATIQEPSGILGNNAQPGDTNNPFPSNLSLWYTVQLKNNPSDLGYAGAACPGGSNPGPDCDGIVVIRSTGHGPDDSVAT